MQQRLYQTKVHDIDEQKQRMLYLACVFEHSVINDAMNEWCKRLCACIRERIC